MVQRGGGDQGGAEGFGGLAVPDAAHIRLFHRHDGHQGAAGLELDDIAGFEGHLAVSDFEWGAPT
jgi:hypothetical protein